MNHGTTYAFKTLKCRCDECREAVNASERKRRASKKSLPPLAEDDPRHGKFSTYVNQGCRCTLCRKANSDKNYARRRGVPIERKEELILEQGNCCAACGRDFEGLRTHYDHNHDTGEYRGVLCGQCNMALGLLGDDLDRILSLHRYLKSHS